MKKNTHQRISARVQRGLTLIEFMISIVIGMLMVAAIATLIANQSTNRAEVDRAGKMIENGRYAMQQVQFDAQLAGYWGEYYQSPNKTTSFGPPSSPPLDPCSTTQSDLLADTMEHIQGYDDSAAAFPSCISNRRAGTDVLVIRRADTDTFDVSSLTQGQYYIQTGLDSATSLMRATIGVGSGVAATDATTFTLKQKDKVTAAKVRKLLVHIYYISTCSVCTGSNADTIPTLKRVELGVSSNAPSMTCATCTTTIAEGIENMQVYFGLDKNADGAPDAYLGADSWDDTTGSKCTVLMGSATTLHPATCWSDVMSVRVFMLARSGEVTPGFTDTKTYVLGPTGTASTAAAAGETGYRRHVFTQTIKLVNPSGRASS